MRLKRSLPGLQMLSLVFLAACSPAQPVSTPSTTAKPSLSPSVPTASPPATGSVTPGPSPTPTASAPPSPSPTPSPTVSPSALPSALPSASPSPSAPSPSPSALPVSFASVQPLFQKYCFACHSFPSSYTETRNMAARIRIRVFVEKSMPQVGSFQSKDITEAERALIARWVDEGAQP